MIIYGWKSSVGEPKKLLGKKCGSCDKSDLSVVTRHHYFHAYWIPLFSLGRDQAAVCENCKKVYEKKEFKELTSTSNALIPEKEPLKVKHFAGVMMVALAVSYFMYLDQENQKRMSEFASAPQVGDVVVFKLDKPIKDGEHTLKYGLYQVAKLAEEGLVIRFSEYQFTDSGTAIKYVNNPPKDMYDEEFYIVKPDQLVHAVASGEVDEIYRTDEVLNIELPENLEGLEKGTESEAEDKSGLDAANAGEHGKSA